MTVLPDTLEYLSWLLPSNSEETLSKSSEGPSALYFFLENVLSVLDILTFLSDVLGYKPTPVTPRGTHRGERWPSGLCLRNPPGDSDAAQV